MISSWNVPGSSGCLVHQGVSGVYTWYDDIDIIFFWSSWAAMCPLRKTWSNLHNYRFRIAYRWSIPNQLRWRGIEGTPDESSSPKNQRKLNLQLVIHSRFDVGFTAKCFNPKYKWCASTAFSNLLAVVIVVIVSETSFHWQLRRCVPFFNIIHWVSLS